MALTSPQKLSQSLFFEESFGRLSQLEQLMTAQRMSVTEWRNVLYLHCHSLKGTATSFGFIEFAACCHDLETQLAALPANDAVESVDCAPILSQIDRLQARLKALQDNPEQKSTATPSVLNHAQDLTLKGWNINFAPHADFFASGYDPLQILRQLEKLGALTVTVNTDVLPEFVTLEPEQCYLSWQCRLDASVPEQVVRDIFDWVAAKCDVELLAIRAKRPIEMPTEGVMLQKISALTAQTEKQQRLIEKLKQNQPQAQLDASQWQDLLVMQIEEINHSLHQDIQKLMMRPLSSAFERLSSQLDALAESVDKQVQLSVFIETLETDTVLVDKISDIVIQLCRNVIAHGIELPAQREALGKHAMGQVTVRAERCQEMLKLTFSDDGAGIDTDRLLSNAKQKGLIAADAQLDQSQVLQLIYQPGMTTAEDITTLAGRGVGLDLVRQLMNSVLGKMQVNSVRGKGCEFVLEMPLSQSLIDCQVCQVADQFYGIPMQTVASVFQPLSTEIQYRSGRGAFIQRDQQWLPVISLAALFRLDPQPASSPWLVIVQFSGFRFALQVDKLLNAGSQLIKPIQNHYQTVSPVSGVVVLGLHTLGLLLDLQQLATLHNIPEQAVAESSVELQ